MVFGSFCDVKALKPCSGQHQSWKLHALNLHYFRLALFGDGSMQYTPGSTSQMDRFCNGQSDMLATVTKLAALADLKSFQISVCAQNAAILPLHVALSQQAVACISARPPALSGTCVHWCLYCVDHMGIPDGMLQQVSDDLVPSQ